MFSLIPKVAETSTAKQTMKTVPLAQQLTRSHSSSKHIISNILVDGAAPTQSSEPIKSQLLPWRRSAWNHDCGVLSRKRPVPRYSMMSTFFRLELEL